MLTARSSCISLRGKGIDWPCSLFSERGGRYFVPQNAARPGATSKCESFLSLDKSLVAELLHEVVQCYKRQRNWVLNCCLSFERRARQLAG